MADSDQNDRYQITMYTSLTGTPPGPRALTQTVRTLFALWSFSQGNKYAGSSGSFVFDDAPQGSFQGGKRERVRHREIEKQGGKREIETERQRERERGTKREIDR